MSAMSERGLFMVSGGIVIPVETGTPAEFLGAPGGDFGVLDHLALSHRAIIGRMGKARLDLCLSAQDFDHKSVKAIIERLERCPRELQVRLRWFLGGWLTEAFSDAEAAATRLRTIGSRALSVPEKRLRLAVQDPGAVCPDTGSLYELWRQHAGRLSSEFLADAGKARVLDRMFALEPDDAAGWIVRFMGDGIGIFADQQSDVVGRPLASISVDRDYADWVAGHHASVLASGESRYDHVDAILSTTAKMPMRVRYRRRLLPFTSQRGKPLVVGYSALTNDLALPL